MKPTSVLLPASVEPPITVRLPDDTLLGYFFVEEKGRRERLACTSSGDSGRTWSEPADALALPTDVGLWAGPEALADRDGEVHLFFLNDRGSGVFGEPQSAPGSPPGPYSGRWLDLWCTRSSHGRTRWRPVKRIWEGFTGALNSVIQLRSGRIVVPFAWYTGRGFENRGQGLDDFGYHGGFSSTVVYSDGNGDTWQRGTSEIKAWAPVNAYGADEPVVLQLNDGRVWMLLRTQTGRLYESLSEDGATWSVARATRLISSDSPVGLVRLLDGRLVLLWNCCQRFGYAYGGRHVLHGAISADEGQTWRGYREVTRDPRRNEPPPDEGDYGTAYPFPVVTADNRVMYRTGQGEDRVQVMFLEPEWLCETRQSSDFSDGLEEWSVFGTRGVELLPHPDRSGAQALRITKIVPGRTAAAVWNFPAGKSGTLVLRLRAEAGMDRFRISLTDHFSTPFDTGDEFNSMFNLGIGPDGQMDGERLEAGRWHELAFAWDCADRRACEVRLDGRPVTNLPQLHETTGVNYVRIVSTAEESDPAGLWIESTVAEVAPD